MYIHERKEVFFVFIQFSGGGGIEHPYLVVKSLTADYEIGSNCGTISFGVYPWDDEEHIPNTTSEAAIQKRFIDNLLAEIEKK